MQTIQPTAEESKCWYIYIYVPRGILFSTHITYTHCIEEMNEGAATHATSHSLLKGTSAMPRTWTSILQLLATSYFFGFEWDLNRQTSSPRAKSPGTELLPPHNCVIAKLFEKKACRINTNFTIFVHQRDDTSMSQITQTKRNAAR